MQSCRLGARHTEGSTLHSEHPGLLPPSPQVTKYLPSQSSCKWVQKCMELRTSLQGSEKWAEGDVRRGHRRGTSVSSCLTASAECAFVHLLWSPWRRFRKPLSKKLKEGKQQNSAQLCIRMKIEILQIKCYQYERKMCEFMGMTIR